MNKIGGWAFLAAVTGEILKLIMIIVSLQKLFFHKSKLKIKKKSHRGRAGLSYGHFALMRDHKNLHVRYLSTWQPFTT